MRDDIRKAILNNKREPDGKCVTCGLPVCKQNRFLCTNHHIAELESFVRRLSRDVISVAIAYELEDKAGNKYANVGPLGMDRK